MFTPSTQDVAECLTPSALIEALRAEFRANGLADEPLLVSPLRAHHVIDAPDKTPGAETHLLMMPAWESGGVIGIKLVGVNAQNPSRADAPQPMVQGIYLLMDAKTGAPLAQFDAQELTFRRTAAVSALAADYLAREDASHLGIIGAGAAMAPYVVAMYRAIRPIRQVTLWNRTADKALGLANSLKAEGLSVHIAESPDELVSSVDIVSSCTPSEDPMIKGDLLRPGTHVDCIGGFRPTMREADDVTLQRAQIYGDTMEGVTQEAGDIMIPLSKGIIQAQDIRGDLFDLCAGRVSGRSHPSEITFFKSVGSALSDLAGAKLVLTSLTAGE